MVRLMAKVFVISKMAWSRKGSIDQVLSDSAMARIYTKTGRCISDSSQIKRRMALVSTASPTVSPMRESGRMICSMAKVFSISTTMNASRGHGWTINGMGLAYS